MNDATLKGERRRIVRAVAHGYPLEERVNPCFTLLPLVVARGETMLLGRLLDLPVTRSHVDQVDCMGHSALHFAVMTANRDAERTLVEHGASLRITDEEGRTPEAFRTAPSLPRP